MSMLAFLVLAYTTAAPSNVIDDVTLLHAFAVEAYTNRSDTAPSCVVLRNSTFSEDILIKTEPIYSSNTFQCGWCATLFFDVTVFDMGTDAAQTRRDALWIQNVFLPSFQTDNTLMMAVHGLDSTSVWPTFGAQPLPPTLYTFPFSLAILYDVSPSSKGKLDKTALLNIVRRMSEKQFFYFQTFNAYPQGSVISSAKQFLEMYDAFYDQVCGASYSGGTRYKEAFQRLFDDVKDVVPKDRPLEIVLISDGNEIQNRKILWKVFDKFDSNNIPFHVHVIDLEKRKFQDKLDEIRCHSTNHRGYYVDLEKATPVDLLNAFWLERHFVENIQVIDGYIMSGRKETSQIVQDVIVPSDEDIFGRKLVGAVSIVISTSDQLLGIARNTTDKSESKDLDRRALATYLGHVCPGDEPTEKEQKRIDVFVAAMRQQEDAPEIHLCPTDKNGSSALCEATIDPLNKCGPVNG